ncbi:PLP-dependent transferase [Vibrio lentus]|nr:PLP-dependent transferase [Vibrio lentus]
MVTQQGNIIDWERVAELAHARGVPVIVDISTVATPVLCKPYRFWCRYRVVHSLTNTLVVTEQHWVA